MSQNDIKFKSSNVQVNFDVGSIEYSAQFSVESEEKTHTARLSAGPRTLVLQRKVTDGAAQFLGLGDQVEDSDINQFVHNWMTAVNSALSVNDNMTVNLDNIGFQHFLEIFKHFLPSPNAGVDVTENNEEVTNNDMQSMLGDLDLDILPDAGVDRVDLKENNEDASDNSIDAEVDVSDNNINNANKEENYGVSKDMENLVKSSSVTLMTDATVEEKNTVDKQENDNVDAEADDVSDNNIDNANKEEKYDVSKDLGNLIKSSSMTSMMDAGFFRFFYSSH